MNEIVERLRARGYVDRNDYGTQNTVRAAMREAGGMLYGRSIYGLEKHLPVSSEVADEALSELEAIILEGAPGRQWHCSELADELALRLPEIGEELDQFGANVILTRSNEVTYLGRLVWVGVSRAEGLQDRLEIAALCEAALLKAGRPLTKRELRDAIRQVRGLNHNFLPQASERVVRLARGKWGLADRDVGVSAQNQSAALDALHQALNLRQKGLHVSELFEALRGIDVLPDSELDEWEFLGISQGDSRFRVGRGQIVGLAAWTDVRRRSIAEALAQIEAGWHGPSSGDQLYAELCALIERPIDRTSFASHAARAGFAHDAATGIWDLAAAAPEADTDLDDENWQNSLAETDAPFSLAALTLPSAVQQALDEFDRIGREAFLEKYGFGKAREYFVQRGTELYDSKAIVGAAYGYQYPDRGPLKSRDFSGGAVTVKAKLKALGFEVVVLPDAVD